MNFPSLSHFSPGNPLARAGACIVVYLAFAFGQSVSAVAAEAPGTVKEDPLPLSGFAGLGSSFAQSSRLPELGWNDEQIQAFVDGVRSALHGKPYLFDDSARQVSGEMGRRVHVLEEHTKNTVSEYSQPGKLEQYMKDVRKRLRLQQTPSGLAYKIDAGRGGLRPRPEDTVVFSCIAHAADGTTDIPQLSAENIRAKMTDLVPGLLEGMQMMTLDSKALLVIPPALSFGNRDWPAGMERGTPLQLQIVLQEIVSATP